MLLRSKAAVGIQVEDVLQCEELVPVEVGVMPLYAMLCESNEIIAWMDCSFRHIAWSTVKVHFKYRLRFSGAVEA